MNAISGKQSSRARHKIPIELFVKVGRQPVERPQVIISTFPDQV